MSKNQDIQQTVELSKFIIDHYDNMNGYEAFGDNATDVLNTMVEHAKHACYDYWDNHNRPGKDFQAWVSAISSIPAPIRDAYTTWAMAERAMFHHARGFTEQSTYYAAHAGMSYMRLAYRVGEPNLTAGQKVRDGGKKGFKETYPNKEEEQQTLVAKWNEIRGNYKSDHAADKAVACAILGNTEKYKTVERARKKLVKKYLDTPHSVQKQTPNLLTDRKPATLLRGFFMLPSHERKLTLQQARKVVKDRGRAVSFETLWRWCRQGLKSGRVRLEYQRIGRQIVTSEGALERFFNRLAADDHIEDRAGQDIHPEHIDAEAALEAAGI